MSEAVKNKNATSYDLLVSEINHILDYRLKELFDSFITNTDDILFDLANEAASNDDQRQYFELLQNIRANKSKLNRGIYRSLKEHLVPISENQDTSGFDFEAMLDDSEGELSLVSQDSMEEMVLINSITAKADDKFKDSIGLLALRLEFLGSRAPALFEKNALKPRNFCLSFQKCISILDITVSDKLVLYKLFDKEVAENLNKIYDALNNTLIEAHVLPDIKLHEHKKKPPVSKKYDHNQFHEMEETHSDETPAQQYSQAANTDYHRLSNSRNQSRDNQSQMTHTHHENGAAGHSTDSDPAYNQESSGEPTAPTAPLMGALTQNPDQYLKSNPGNPPANNAYAGGYPVEKATKIINDFIGNNTQSISAEGNTQYYGHKDVLSALSQMQAVNYDNIQTSEPVVEKVNAAELKHTLLTTIASQTNGTITKQVDGVIDKTIDFIKLIFDAIIDDHSISDTIKALILTLQIPVIKASLINKEFFVDDHHPARQLLEKMAELGLLVNSSTDPLYLDINEIIKNLLNQYDDDLNAFCIALEDIKKLLTQLKLESDNKEREVQEIVQKEHARNIVLKELRKISLGKHLPNKTHKLVLKVWPTIMYNHFLLKGKENDEWVFLATTLHDLVTSVQAPENNSMHSHIRDNCESILNTIESVLKKSSRYKSLISEINQDLQDTYSSILNNFKHKTPENDSPSLTNQDNQETSNSPEGAFIYESVSDPKKDTLKLLPNDVRPGVWFKLKTDSGATRRLKLSVIIIEEALLIFVDHLGKRLVERTAEEFSTELENNEAQIIMTHSVFDHALTSAINTIEKKAI